MAGIDLNTKCDPLVFTIIRDVQTYTALAVDVRFIKGELTVIHNDVIHPSDGLLEAWYRFKEMTCPLTMIF